MEPANLNEPNTTSEIDNHILSGRSLPLLRQILNTVNHYPTFYQNNKDKLQAADIAYFAHESSLDNGPIGDDEFHKDFEDFRSGTENAEVRSIIQLRLRRNLFDHAAKLDHITGGATLVVHIPAAMEPLTPAQPEYIKAYVYAPGTIIREYQRESRENPIPDIVQLVIREIGVPAVERYERARSRRWPYRRNFNAPKPRPLPAIQGMPEPIPKGSSRYLFYGRRYCTSPDPDRYFAPVGVWDTGSDEDMNARFPIISGATSSTTMYTDN